MAAPHSSIALLILFGSRWSPCVRLFLQSIIVTVCIRYGLTREQLAMVSSPPPSFPPSNPNHNSNCIPSQVSVLMSRQAQHHPAALTRTPHTLAQVLSAPSVAPVTGILECARRSDGGAALLLASTRFLVAHGLQNRTCPVVISGAEASGPLFPPKEISESMFSCDDAAKAACVQKQRLS